MISHIIFVLIILTALIGFLAMCPQLFGANENAEVRAGDSMLFLVGLFILGLDALVFLIWIICKIW